MAWFAIILGFAGVVLIVRPDAGEFRIYVLLPLVAAVLYALAMMLTRTKCRHEDPKVLSLALNVTFVVMGVVATIAIKIWRPDQTTVDINPFLLGSWTDLNLNGWLAMCALGVSIVLGSVFAAIAYQNGPSSTVASFDYSYLAFSILWGLLFFSEVPDFLSIVGIVMIAGAGLIAVKN